MELEDFNAVVDASCADILPAARRGRTRGPAEVGDDDRLDLGPHDEAARAEPDRLLRLPEVERLTGMSRSTIYDRIRKERFPHTVEMKGNIAAWRESDLRRWLASPQ